MSGSNENNNIVDLQQRQATLSAAASDRLGELLKSVRGTALKRINGLVGTLFENIDDALFDLAEKAENNAAQTQYFDGMREVRKKRQLVERLFQEHLSKIFSDFASGKLQPMKPEVSAQSSAGLSLVDDQELEESLAIASTVAKAENRHARQLYAVNQRLSVIRGGANVEDSTNPIAPAPLCQAFRLAMRELELNVQAKLIIYKLFDRYVMSGLDALYDEINTQLIQAGVLPQIKHRVGSTARPPGVGGPLRVPGTGSGPPGGQPAEDGYHGNYQPVQEYDPAAAQLQAEIYGQLRSLLANRRVTQYGGGNEGPIGGEQLNNGMPMQSIAPTDLLSALTILQNQAMMAQTHATTAVDAAQSVQQIKHELFEQAGKFNADRKAHVTGADEDTIDLVGMLFEFIVQDRNLPPEMQALLSRLQIPYLKAAILDKHLFAQKSHPARQLLDQMAQACIGWSEESDRDHRLHDKVKDTVESLLKNFDDDVGIFERSRDDFENFIEGSKKRSDLAEQRAAEATRGREKLHEARRIAAAEILKRIEGRQLPALMQNVLTRPWANYLVLTLLRQGETSNEWKQALRFADEFVWSAEPKTSDVEKTRLKSLMPLIEKHLRHGLTTVAYHDNDIKHLMQGLHTIYDRQLSSGSSAIPAPSAEISQAEQQSNEAFEIISRQEDSHVPATDTAVEEIVLRTVSEPEPAPEAGYSADDEYLKQARALKVGTWVEFTNEETKTRERAKLSWISPITSKYLFVNRKGLKVADKTVFALAAEMRRSATLVLEEVPLFDRALDAIVERLKASHAPNVDPAPAAP